MSIGLENGSENNTPNLCKCQHFSEFERCRSARNGSRGKSARNVVVYEETIESHLQPHSGTERRKEPLNEEIEANTAQAKPLTTLRKGNSDPLQDFAIPIDTRVAQIMTYTKELYLPEQDNSEQKRLRPQCLQHTCLATIVDSSLSYCAPSIRSYLDSCRLDPFHSSKISMTPQMEDVFIYYFCVIMPAVEPVQAEREEYNQWLVPLTVSEPALFFALVGCMAYDIEQASVTGFGTTSRKNMATERVRYKIRAIQALNKCLADPKTAAKPSTLIAVHFLLWQEEHPFYMQSFQKNNFNCVARSYKYRPFNDGSTAYSST
jgi:hypothetical protein